MSLGLPLSLTWSSPPLSTATTVPRSYNLSLVTHPTESRPSSLTSKRSFRGLSLPLTFHGALLPALAFCSTLTHPSLQRTNTFSNVNVGESERGWPPESILMSASLSDLCKYMRLSVSLYIYIGNTEKQQYLYILLYFNQYNFLK